MRAMVEGYAVAGPTVGLARAAWTRKGPAWHDRAMTTAAEPVLLDLGDFDAVGVATDVVMDLREAAFRTEQDAGVAISAPEGWHGLVLTAKGGAHVVLAVRYR